MNSAPATTYRVTLYGQHVGDLIHVSGGWQFSAVSPAFRSSKFTWPTPEAAAREHVHAAAIVEVAP